MVQASQLCMFKIMKEKATNCLKELIPIRNPLGQGQTVYQHSTIEQIVSKILFFFLT